MHDRWIGVTPRAELNDPCPIFLAIFLRPFLDKIVAKIGRGIAAVTTSARHTASKMNVFDDFFQVHVRRRRGMRIGRNRKQVPYRLVC